MSEDGMTAEREAEQIRRAWEQAMLVATDGEENVEVAWRDPATPIRRLT